MGLATQPVWGKTSGFPLDYAQIGVSFYNNKESQCNTGAPSQGPDSRGRVYEKPRESATIH